MPFLVGDHSCSGNTLARNTKVTKKKTKLFTVLSLSVLTCQQSDVFERMNGMTQLILYSHYTGKPLHGHEKPYRRRLLFRRMNGDFCNETKQRHAAPVSIKVESQISDGLCAKQFWDIHERGRGRDGRHHPRLS